MSTFDSTRGTVETDESPQAFNLGEDANPLSPLAMLRSMADEAYDFPDLVVENPTRHMRLTLRTRIENAEVTRWRRAGLPSSKGNRGGMPDLSRLDTYVMFARAIVDTCVQLEIRPDDKRDYQVIRDTDGEPLTLKDPALLSALSCADPMTAVRKIFAQSEPHVIRAGGELLRQAGYGEVEEDDPQD